MSKYNCTVIFDASVNVSIEADTPEDAADQAENETQGRQNLCHQCSNDLDTGDSIGVLVYNDDHTKELLDTRYKPQLTWVGLMRGVRVEGDTVVISVKGGNEAARELCGKLINEMNT